MRLFIPVLLMCLAGLGCGRLFEDNGAHLAYLLERGAGELRASGGSELVLRYTTLDAPNVGYYVEITASEPGQESNAANSYLVVSGKTPGGTSYHNRFVFVPMRLYVRKERGGTTEVVLRKDGQHVNVVDVR
ncbi:MAG TPA: hypothetical protein VKB36_13290 [Vicinamibacterales bacterium]|nr:hypothetical protein [Vicinamibacterales bacterium]